MASCWFVIKKISHWNYNVLTLTFIERDQECRKVHFEKLLTQGIKVITRWNYGTLEPCSREKKICSKKAYKQSPLMFLGNSWSYLWSVTTTHHIVDIQNELLF